VEIFPDKPLPSCRFCLNRPYFALVFLPDSVYAVEDRYYLRFCFFDDFEMLPDNDRLEELRFALPVKRIEFRAKARHSLIEIALRFTEPSFFEADFHEVQKTRPGNSGPFQDQA